VAIGKPIRVDCYCALLSDHFALLSDHFALLSDQGDRDALENLRQRPKLANERLILQEWLNLALSDATAAAVQTLRVGA
jgi:hypothetical protein